MAGLREVLAKLLITIAQARFLARNSGSWGLGFRGLGSRGLCLRA